METTLNGARIHWREAGAGQNVALLIHAFPLNAEMWEPQLNAVPDGWRFIAPDLRGFGRSGPGEGEAPLHINGFADDLAALLEHLDVPRAVVGGVSMGGYTAFALWRRHPERVRALVLSDTRAGQDNEQARENRYALADRVLREGARAASEAMLDRMISEQTKERAPAVVERLRTMIESTSPVTISRALKGLAARQDSTPLLPEIRVPTLVIVGEDDQLTPPSEAETIAAGIPGARLARIPGAGHFPNLEQPDAFNAAFTGFLAGL